MAWYSINTMSREMTTLEKDNFIAYFDLARQVLGSLNDLPKYKGVIELTVNYPLTAAYKRMTEEQSKDLHRTMITYLKLKCDYIKNCEVNFETCKSGKLHMHAALAVEFTRCVCKAGIVEDICRILLMNFFTLKYNRFQERCMFRQLARYWTPQITAQYVEVDDKKRTEDWCDYIRKDILKT